MSETFDNIERLKAAIADSVPKKTAALEVYKVHNRAKVLSIGGIISVFIVAVFSVKSILAGSIVAGILAAFFAWAIVMDVKRIKYLEDEYKIKPSKQVS